MIFPDMPTPIEEKEWWDINLDILEARAWDVSSHTDPCVIIPERNFVMLKKFVKDIVTESNRRGIEQGKREAWEEIKMMYMSEMAALEVLYGTAIVPERFLLKIQEKLSNPQKKV